MKNVTDRAMNPVLVQQNDIVWRCFSEAGLN